MGIRFIFCAVTGIFLVKEKAPLQPEEPTLLCASNLTTKEVVRSLVVQYLRHNKYPSKKQSAKLILTLLLISGNLELNPGPTNIKYPSGECAKAVKFGPSNTCDQCNICSHQECGGVNSTIFEYHTNKTIAMDMHQMWAPKHIGAFV